MAPAASLAFTSNRDGIISTLIDRTVPGGAAVAPAPREELEHLKPLDGVRGIAILLVIIPHILSAGLLPAPHWVEHVVETSAHGVDLFFVLSGFGIAYPLLAQWQARKSIRFDIASYAFNRAYRILPLFYFAVGLAYGVALLAHIGHIKYGSILVAPHTLYQAVAPLLLLDWGNVGINSALWTIPVQFRWYAAFPLLLLLWIKSPRAFAFFLGCAWIGYLCTRARMLDLGTLPCFMLGIVAAGLIVRRHPWTRYASVLLPVAFVAALVWDSWAMIPDPWGNELHVVGQPTSLPWQLSAFALVLVAATFRSGRRVFSWPPLVALGTGSFSIYLVHEPVIALVRASGGPGLVSSVLAFVISLAAGFGLWWSLERRLTDPMRRRGLREHALPVIRRLLRWLGLPFMLEIAPAIE